MAWFYTFNPPPELGGGTTTKIGITEGFPDGRLGKYQLPYGPCWEAHYTWLIYHPDLEVIKWIESMVLGHFRHRSVGLGPGMTEWVTNTTWQEVRDVVLLVCKENAIDIVDCGQGPWNPVRIQEELKIVKENLSVTLNTK